MVKNAQAINGTVGAFLVLTWLAVVLRVYIRAFMLRKLQLADYFIVLTQVGNPKRSCKQVAFQLID